MPYHAGDSTTIVDTQLHNCVWVLLTMLAVLARAWRWSQPLQQRWSFLLGEGSGGAMPY
jgi:hypothetical protein